MAVGKEDRTNSPQISQIIVSIELLHAQCAFSFKLNAMHLNPFIMSHLRIKGEFPKPTPRVAYSFYLVKKMGTPGTILLVLQ